MKHPCVESIEVSENEGPYFEREVNNYKIVETKKRSSQKVFGNQVVRFIVSVVIS